MTEILDFQAGQRARMNGTPRDKRRNQHWLLGWDMMNADLLWADSNKSRSEDK